MIEFRGVTTKGDIKCDCGRVTGSYASWKTQFRIKTASGWAKWKDVPVSPPRIEVTKDRVEKKK